MVEVERVRYTETSEREKKRALIKARKEQEKRAEGVKAKVECP